MKKEIMVLLSLPFAAFGMGFFDKDISRAESFILGAPLKAVGNEWVMYPHYLNAENKTFYLELRATTAEELNDLKEKSNVDYSRLVCIAQTLDLLSCVKLDQKLLPQIAIKTLLDAQAQRLDGFEENFEAEEQDFAQEEHAKWATAQNRKKFLTLLQSKTATKEELNEAAQTEFGTHSLHDYFTGVLALASAMQHLNDDQPLHSLGVCAFWSRNLSEEDREKFKSKVKEMTEKLNKTR